MEKKIVLIDFDGVIADSYDVCLETAKAMCTRMTDELYRHCFEGNVYDTHRALLAEDHGPLCKHDMDWWEYYVPRFEERARVFPGAFEVIRDLSHKYVLIIVSSSVASPINSFLHKHKMEKFITDVFPAEIHTHKLEKFKKVFQAYKVGPTDCVFITDTLGDTLEAQKAGLQTIGCTWGWHRRETLEKGTPFCIVDSPSELPAAVSAYFAKSNA